MQSKIWIIPDVHGAFKTLRTLIEDLISPSNQDKIILLGDLVDRGINSKEIIDYIWDIKKTGTNIEVLKGNHEYYLETSYYAEKEISPFFRKLNKKSNIFKDWLKHGGDATLKSFKVNNPIDIPFEYIKWISELPYYVELEDFIIVHAGLNFNNDDVFADKHSMMWIRDFVVDRNKINGKRIIHGHVPVHLDLIFQSVENNFDFIDLDNGVYINNKSGYGNLLAFEVNSKKIIIQPNID